MTSVSSRTTAAHAVNVQQAILVSGSSREMVECGRES